MASGIVRAPLSLDGIFGSEIGFRLETIHPMPIRFLNLVEQLGLRIDERFHALFAERCELAGVE
jgi:hypothetical protein